MRLLTLNVRGNPPMRPRHVVADVERAASLADVILWQEIRLPYYKRAVRELDDFETYFAKGGIAISWRRSRFELLDSGVQLAHRGRAGASPRRYVSWVKLRDRRTGVVFVAMNAHFVSGAWNAKRKLFKSWRRRQWVKHFETHRRLIADFVRDELTIVGGGDYNRVGVERFHRKQRWLWHARGIDYLWYVEGSSDARVEKTRRIRGGWHSDHDARLAVIELRRHS